MRQYSGWDCWCDPGFSKRNHKIHTSEFSPTALLDLSIAAIRLAKIIQFARKTYLGIVREFQLLPIKATRVLPNYACVQYDYRPISNISRTTSHNLNGTRLVLQLPLPNPLKPGVKSIMKMWLVQSRQAMLHLYLSDRQFYCLQRCDLY